jgi:flagellar biosynthetic protein FliR
MEVFAFLSKYLTQGFLHSLIIIVSRVGPALMVFPGFGDKFVPGKIRFLFAIALCFTLTPMLSHHLGEIKNHFSLISTIAIEVFYGVFLGFSARIMLHSVHVMGTIVSMQSGLSAAMLFDPIQSTQSSIISNLYSNFALMFIFSSDMHLNFIQGLLESYDIMPLAQIISIGDFSSSVSSLVNKSFEVAFKLASPFIIVSILVNTVSGILARLMPNFQVFFVLTPAQILILFGLIFVTFKPVLVYFMEQFSQAILLQFE